MGNILWNWYHRLTREQQARLVAEVQVAGWAKTTFFADTQPERALSAVPFARLDWYREWFRSAGIDEDLLELARAERPELKAAA